MRALALVALFLALPARGQIIGGASSVGFPAGVVPFQQMDWATPIPIGEGWGGSLIKTTPKTLVHVGFTAGGTNYQSASSSPCWTGDVVNSPHWLLSLTTCVNDATTGPDGRPADQFTKSNINGKVYRVLGASDTISSVTFSSTAVGRHPTSNGYFGTGADCSSPPSGCSCSACVTTDGSTCGASVTCTPTTNTNTCNASAAIDNTGWVKVSAIATCSAPQTTTTCQTYPGRFGNDVGATAYITDTMCQDTTPTAYIHTSGTNGSSTTLIGSTSGVRTIKGAAWRQIGGLRQNNPVSTTPAKVGVGPMITSYGYLEYPITSDPADVATFSACAVVVPATAALSTTNLVAHNHQDPVVNGWQFVLYETGSARLFGYNGGVSGGTVAQTSAWSAGVVNLACWGFDSAGSTCYLRQNKGTVASSGSCTHTPETSGKLRLGIHHDLLLPFLGTIVEFWISQETPSQSVFDRVAAEVEARGGITLP